MTFSHDLDMVLAFEGGYANDPDDSGGATNFGVIQKTYDAFRTKNKLALQSVKEITRQEVEEIYMSYYKACYADKIDLINPLVASQVFDFAINAGPSQAVKTLQKMLGTVADGIYGPATAAALKAECNLYGPVKVSINYAYERIKFYISLCVRKPTQRKFLFSWISRTLVASGTKL